MPSPAFLPPLKVECFSAALYQASTAGSASQFFLPFFSSSWNPLVGRRGFEEAAAVTGTPHTATALAKRLLSLLAFSAHATILGLEHPPFPLRRPLRLRPLLGRVAVQRYGSTELIRLPPLR